MFNKLSRLKIKGDGIIWMVFFLLCIVSVLEVYSASSSLTYKAGNYWNPVLYHTILLFFGVGFMIVTMNIKCKYFKIVTPFALVISLVMLIAVLIVGQSTNGAQRWIGLFGIQFQPSEIAKGAVILAEAQILSAMQTIDGADRRAFKYILFVSLPIIFLIAMENLSTAALLFLTVIIMMFIGRVPKVQLGRLMGVLALLAASGFAMIMLVGNDAKEPTDSEKMNMTEQVVEKKEAPGFMAKRNSHPKRLTLTRTHRRVMRRLPSPPRTSWVKDRVTLWSVTSSRRLSPTSSTPSSSKRWVSWGQL